MCTYDTQTLTNKTFTDNTTYFQDDLDNTKKLQLQLSGITTSTTRTLTIPDADTTIVGTNNIQTLTNKTIDADNNTVSNIENDNIKANAAIDAAKIGNGTVSNTEFQYLNGLTSGIQTQINDHQNASAAHGTTGSIVGTSDIQTLTNKTFTDNTTYFQDDIDNTKKLQLQLSSITTSTTRTLTIPDADTTIVGIDNIQTLTNKTIDADNNTISNIENDNIKANAAIDADKIGNGTVSNTEFQYLNGLTSGIQTQINDHQNASAAHGTTGSIVGTSDTQTLTNKTFTDNTTYFQDDLDNTKKLQLQLSGITTSTTRTLTIPDANTTIVGTNNIQTLTNKNLVDANTSIVNSVDPTKRVIFNLTGGDPNRSTTFSFIQTANRIITVPDTTDTLVTTSLSQMLNNKTLTHISNNIVANQLRTFDGNAISINNTAVPSSGQVLTATSTTTAEWQANPGGNTVGYTLFNGQAKASSVTYTTVAYMPWLQSRYNSYANGVIVFRVNINNRNLDIRLQDVTNVVTLGQSTVTSTGTASFTVTNPSSDAQLELQIKKSATGGSSPRIYGILLEYNIL